MLFLLGKVLGLAYSNLAIPWVPEYSKLDGFEVIGNFVVFSFVLKERDVFGKTSSLFCDEGGLSYRLV